MFDVFTLFFVIRLHIAQLFLTSIVRHGMKYARIIVMILVKNIVGHHYVYLIGTVFKYLFCDSFFSDELYFLLYFRGVQLD